MLSDAYEQAILRIQSAFRRHQAQKRARELRKRLDARIDNMTRYREKVIQMTSFFRVRLGFYIDEDITELGIALKNEGNGQNIVKMKTLKLIEFLDENTSIIDVCNTIEEMLVHHAQTLIIDP